MARLHKNPYPGGWRFLPGEDVNRYIRRTDDLLSSIPENRIMSFPVADGRACYYVVSEKPFVLQHIPCGDAYRIPDAHLRGLRLEDWEKQKRFRDIFLNKQGTGNIR